MWEGVEISFHIPSFYECQKCKMSGRQEKCHHDDWCNLVNQKTNNTNIQSPQKPSSKNASDEKNDDETTSDKFCNGSENVEGRQEKCHHDDWCNLGNRKKTNNTNIHSPQKPSSKNASDEKDDDETTSDKFCNGSEKVEGKNVETSPSRVLVNESKTNSAATLSEEKQKDGVFNNQVVVFSFLLCKRKKKKI